MPDDVSRPDDGALVQPRTLKGFQDFLPGDAIARSNVIQTIRQVYERFGFVPIETPALEYLASLVGTGGEDTNKQLFRLKSPEHEDIALRFDLTVPFARITAQYLDDLKLPFRRYHVGPVWRADKPGPGRFREFTQIDLDAAGSADMAADAEILRVLCDVMAALDVSDYVIEVNHRKIVDALLAACGIPDEQTHKHVLRVIDKLPKVGLDAVRAELGDGRVDESGDPIKGVHLDPDTIGLIERFIAVGGATRAEVFDGVRQVLPSGEQPSDALAELQELLDALDGLAVDEEHVRFTPSLARGLDYYTGPVFETRLPGAPQVGSIMGGGRYDGLVRRFLGLDIPATGASIGLDRFLAGLAAVQALEPPSTTTLVLVTVMDRSVLSYCLSVASDLRDAGINTEVYFGAPNDRLSAQLALANRRGIPVAIIAGSNEVDSATVAIKDLRAGMAKRKDIADREKYRAAGRSGQVTVPRAECVAAVRQMLG